MHSTLTSSKNMEPAHLQRQRVVHDDAQRPVTGGVIRKATVPLQRVEPHAQVVHAAVVPRELRVDAAPAHDNWAQRLVLMMRAL